MVMKKLISLKYELMQGIYEGEPYDFDRYNVEMRSPMATHEYSVVVNHKKKTLSGDCVRYGSWDDLIEEEILEILELVKKEGELKRPYTDDYKIIEG